MTTPWQTLTDAEIRDLSHRGLSPWALHLIRKVEEALRERNTPITPEFFAGWQAAFNAVFEELQFSPPSKVGEARFTARLVLLKHDPQGGLRHVYPHHPAEPVQPPSDSQPPGKGE